LFITYYATVLSILPAIKASDLGLSYRLHLMYIIISSTGFLTMDKGAKDIIS
jgi:hypothetical protein